jgi:hypothetical protein
MSCEYIQKTYGVPAEIGRRVVAYGKPGIIVEDRGHYIGVTLDSEKPGKVNNYHPTDGIVYEGMGKIRPMTKAQRRYQDFLRCDFWNGTFVEYCQWKDAKEKEHAA